MAQTRLASTLAHLTASFTEAVLEAIRGSSLEELVGATGRGPRSRATLVSPPRARASGRPSGRRKRRSRAEIDQALARVLALVKRNKAGLRAEQIRTDLGMQRKDLPRVLHEGLATKALRSQGQKRATRYFAVQ
jgi:hypothetical protein